MFVTACCKWKRTAEELWRQRLVSQTQRKHWHCVSMGETASYSNRHTCRPVDGTSMNEECEAVKTTLWAEAPTAGWPPSLRSEIFNVSRRCAPSSHVSNEHTQKPMAGKIRDDWWVRPSHGEASRLRQPRFWIRVFLLLDRLPAKANEPCLPTQTHTHTHTHAVPHVVRGQLKWLVSIEQFYMLPVTYTALYFLWALHMSDVTFTGQTRMWLYF